MVSKGNYKYSHTLLLSTQTIIRKDCNQSPFSFKFSEGSARLQPRAWLFSCIVRFARQTNKKKDTPICQKNQISSFYSQLSLRQTPLGPALSVLLREVSIL